MKNKIDVEYYQEYLNLQEASFLRIVHEDAIVAVVYRIICSDGTNFILKISSRKKDYFREVHYLKCLAGEIPVPRIIRVVPPEGEIHGAILMECLPGELLKAHEMSGALAHELGGHLARIHNYRLSEYGDPIEGMLSNNPEDYFTFKFNEGLNECKGHLSAGFIETCQRYYDSQLDLFDAVDGPCVVHRDFRPGNLIVSDGKLSGIIDWAGARAGFAEEDFCLLEHGDWLNQHLTDFLAGYASVRPVPQYKPLIPFLRFNKAIATIGFTVKRGTWKTTDARIYHFNRSFLETLLSK